MSHPDDFSAQIYRSMGDIAPAAWDALSAGRPFQSSRWYAYGERVMADCPPFYITLHLDGKPVGRGTFYLVRDEPLPLPSPARSLLRPALRRWPLLLCCAPLANASGLLLPEGADRSPARARLLTEAEAIARQNRCSFVLCDYVEAEETRQEWPAGYRSMTVADPGTCLPVEWPDFESYLAARNKKDRQHYKRSLREAEKRGIRVTRRSRVPAPDEFLPLIRSVEKRHGVDRNLRALAMLEHLEMAGGTFLEARIGGHAAGCGLLLYDNGVQVAAALGLAEDVPFVYFALVYESLRDAFERKTRLLRWGSGAYEVKKQLGFREETNNHSVFSGLFPLARAAARLATAA